MAKENSIVDKFEKCANYTLMTALVANTVNSMKRFSGLPKDKVITKIYTAIKNKAANSAA